MIKTRYIKNPTLLCVDPGTYSSGIIILKSKNKEIIYYNKAINNETLIDKINKNSEQEKYKFDYLIFEMISNYGMPMGDDTIQTILMIGRIIEAAGKKNCRKILRQTIKSEICHNPKAEDSNVRQAIIDMYPRTGSGKVPQIGTKKFPGPLYGITSHAWSALAVGLAWISINKKKIF